MDMDTHPVYAQGIPSPDDHFIQQRQQPQQLSPASSQSLIQSAVTHSPDAQHQLLQQQQQQHQQQPIARSPTQAQQQHAAHMQNQHSGQQQQSQQAVQAWPSAPPHLLQQNNSSFPSPAPSSAPLDPSQSQSQSVYPYFHSHTDHRLERATAAGAYPLSLNISSLSVASPASLSPITPSPHPSTASTTTLSPVTPLSPCTSASTHTTPQAHAFAAAHHHHRAQQQQGGAGAGMFAYAVPEHHAFDLPLHAPAGTRAPHAHRRSTVSSRSSSSSGKSSVPRKRSFTGGQHLPAAVEESVYERGGALELASATFEDVELGYGYMDSQGSPVEGSSSGGEHDSAVLGPGTGPQVTTGNTSDIAQSVSVMTSKAAAAATTGTNNFVSKLYQMIIDPKSTHFIQWNEHGSSFIVSNVGEFSRTILGAHFKHNNFSSFVRQLNMYGFHKINRTPRAQRSSSDAQTWEFSHPRFLRGRPDLLEDIKRKALEPDPAIKHRVELPGEVAAQLGQMRETNRRVARALETERVKNECLTSVVKNMHDFLYRTFPGSVPSFPPELWEAGENPPIYITSPVTHQSASRYPPSMGMPFHMQQPFSPTSSPTNIDFPPPTQQQQQQQPETSHGHGHGHGHGHHHQLGRTHSLQHIPYDPNYGHVRYDQQQQVVMELDEGDGGGAGGGAGASDRKRQRTTAGGAIKTEAGAGEDGPAKRLARARSDSAPLGYSIGSATGLGGHPSWAHGGGGHAHVGIASRPRSGTNLVPPPRAGGGAGRRDDVLMLNTSGRAVSSVCTTQATSPLANFAPKIGS